MAQKTVALATKDDLDKKAEANGSNATGDWGINITGNAKTATSADSATKDASGNVITETYSKTNHTHNYAGSSSAGGVANSATKLATSRTVRTNLSSTSTASFDGSANIEPGVTGTLPVANGGTGKTTLGDSANALINGLSTGSDAPKDNDYYISQYAGGGTTTTTFHRRPVSALWEYIKGKISSVLGLTASSYSGNSATATKLNTNAGSATQPTYFAGGIPKACTYSLNKTVPANAVFTDTDTKVTNTLATTTKAYVTGTTSASTNTGTQVFDTGVYLDTTSGQLTATTFKGSLNGNAATATSASNIANNLTTTVSGYSLDARQGKTLNDNLNTLKSRVDNCLIYGDTISSGMISYLPEGYSYTEIKVNTSVKPGYYIIPVSVNNNHPGGVLASVNGAPIDGDVGGTIYISHDVKFEIYNTLFRVNAIAIKK